MAGLADLLNGMGGGGGEQAASGASGAAGGAGSGDLASMLVSALGGTPGENTPAQSEALKQLIGQFAGGAGGEGSQKKKWQQWLEMLGTVVAHGAEISSKSQAPLLIQGSGPTLIPYRP